jgi:tRNA-dihydrouridine synthase 2
MIREVCHEAGVACLMNGDVESRDSAAELIKEFGVDGAMIATAAEKNSSCFRSKEQGGMAPWGEVTETYLRFAMETENKFGNTKYMLNQIIPGKQPAYKRVQSCKGYTAVCEALGLNHLKDAATDADKAVGIIVDSGAKSAATVNGSAKRKTQANPASQASEEVATKRQKTDEPAKETEILRSPVALSV